jgi:hypothetical protein
MLVHAEWRHLTEAPFGSMTYDTATTPTKDGKTLLQYRLEFATPRKNTAGKDVSSATMHVAIDCAGHTVTLIDLTSHAGKGGQGDVVETQSFPSAPAEKVSAASSNQMLYDAACGKLPPVPPPKAK